MTELGQAPQVAGGMRSAPGCWASVQIPGAVDGWGERCTAEVRWRGRWRFSYPAPGHWVVVESCDGHWRDDMWLRRMTEAV